MDMSQDLATVFPCDDDERHHGGYDRYLAGVLEIDGCPLVDHGLNLTDPPVRLVRMPHEVAWGEFLGHRTRCGRFYRRKCFGATGKGRPSDAACRHVGEDRKSPRLTSSTNAHLVCRLLLEKQP